jgi:hypothetical protein
MKDRLFTLSGNTCIACDQTCSSSTEGGYAVWTINEARIIALNIDPSIGHVSYCLYDENVHRMTPENVQRPDLKQADKITPRVCLNHLNPNQTIKELATTSPSRV